MDDKEYREYVVKRLNNIKSADDIEFMRGIVSGKDERFNKILSNFRQSLFTKSTNETVPEPDPLVTMIEQIADYVARGLKLFAKGAKADKIVIYNASELETGDGPVADLFSGGDAVRLNYIRLREMVESHEDASGEASFCYYTAEGVWLEFLDYCEDTNSALEEVCKKVSKAFGGVPCYLNGSTIK